MPDHANVDLVRRGYEAFDKGDLQTVDEVPSRKLFSAVPVVCSGASDTTE